MPYIKSTLPLLCIITFLPTNNEKYLFLFFSYFKENTSTREAIIIFPTKYGINPI